jgi:hypothetical protein
VGLDAASIACHQAAIAQMFYSDLKHFVTTIPPGECFALYPETKKATAVDNRTSENIVTIVTTVTGATASLRMLLVFATLRKLSIDRMVSVFLT